MDPLNLFSLKSEAVSVHRPPIPPLPLVLSRLAPPARAARAPQFPLPISWGSQSHFLPFSNAQNILKMVEHSLKHKHTYNVNLFPESIVDSHTGCDEGRLRPPYKSLEQS